MRCDDVTSRRPLAIAAAGALAAAGLAACTPVASTPGGGAGTPQTPAASSAWPSSANPAAEPVSFTLVSAGDVLPHTSVYEAARSGGSFDFTAQWRATIPYTEGADVALCSLEVPIAPAGTEPSGYPMFGAPPELVENLKQAGWDGCTLATNHTGDRGWVGLEATLEAFDDAGLGHTGVGRSDAERARPAYYRVEKDGRSFTLAHVAGTYGLNGMPDPGAQRGFQAVTMLSDLAAAAKTARQAGADVVVVSPHWGIEYQLAPERSERDLAAQLAATGDVDAIIGTHPHVPQPIETLAGPDGAQVPVVYSTGNFFSGQDETCCVREAATGLIVQLPITVDDDGAHVGQLRYAPVTMDLPAGRKQFMLADLHDGDRPAGLTLSAATIDARWRALLAVMGEDALDPSVPDGGATVTRFEVPGA